MPVSVVVSDALTLIPLSTNDFLYALKYRGLHLYAVCFCDYYLCAIIYTSFFNI